MDISSGDIGASYELLVSAELMQRGFDVFRNLSPNGPVDLVVYRDGKLLRVQVKGSPHAFDAEKYDVLAHYDRKRNETSIWRSTSKKFLHCYHSVRTRNKMHPRSAHGRLVYPSLQCPRENPQSEGSMTTLNPDTDKFILVPDLVRAREYPALESEAAIQRRADRLAALKAAKSEEKKEEAA